MARLPDRYNSFSALRERETEGVDYRVRVESRSSPVAIIAPHAGFIEPATSEIALTIANGRFSLYRFEGLDPARLHHELHVTSENFDEPIANDLVANSAIVIAIHGRADREDPESSWIGGLDTSLRNLIVEALRRDGFAAVARKKGRRSRELRPAISAIAASGRLGCSLRFREASGMPLWPMRRSSSNMRLPSVGRSMNSAACFRQAKTFRPPSPACPRKRD